MEEKSNNPIKIPWGVIGLIVTLVGILVTLVSIAVTIRDTRSRVVTVQTGIERVEDQILANQYFRITYPSDGDFVDLTDLVRGKTPFSRMNHYIVITPLKIGDDWIQGGVVKVYTGGSWTGRARFGTASVGAGEQFVVRALVTKSSLSPGPLTEVPEDAIFSESITVTRKK